MALWYSWDKETGEIQPCTVSHGLSRFGSESNRLVKTVLRIGGTECEVSTVFCGNGGPRFETRIFGGPLDGEEQTHETEKEAREAHAKTVRRCRRRLRYATWI